MNQTDDLLAEEQRLRLSADNCAVWLLCHGPEDRHYARVAAEHRRLRADLERVRDRLARAGRPVALRIVG